MKKVEYKVEHEILKYKFEVDGEPTTWDYWIHSVPSYLQTPTEGSILSAE